MDKIDDFLSLGIKNKQMSSSCKYCIEELFDNLIEGQAYAKNKVYDSKGVRIYFPSSVRKPTTLEPGEYVPIEIFSYIKTMKHYIQFEFTFFSRKVHIYFITISPPNIPIFIDYIYNMITVLYLLEKYSSKDCKRSSLFSIYLYLTPFEKKINTGTIGAFQINTGINTKPVECSSHPEYINEIIIYRKEDWFKVFIHESIHSFRLDFSFAGEEILSILKIDSQVNVFEAYVEFWAEIINALYGSILYSKSPKMVMSTFEKIIQAERKFSLYQMEKILRTMNLSYFDIIQNNGKMYKEESNVLSYFVLKTILLDHYSDFICACKKNNENLLNYDEKNKFIIDFIFAYYNNDEFLRNVKRIQNVKCKKYNNTAKMCLLELF